MDSMPQRPTKPSPAEAALGVVEALYAFAQQPAQWSEVIAAIDALPYPLDPAQDAMAVKILEHTTRAAVLIDRLNDGRPKAQRAEARWDALLLSSEHRLRGIVGNAERRLQPFLKGALVLGEPVLLTQAATKIVSEALAGSRGEGEASLAPFTLTDDRNAVRCFGFALPRLAFPDTLSKAFQLGAVWAEPLYALVLLSTRDVEVTPNRLGLTAAEGKLAALLARGASVSDAAVQLGVSAHTARTQLKHIFAKTGTRRQSELIRLLVDESAFSPPLPKSQSLALQESPPRRVVRLSDGRSLFYREYGVESGPVVIYFHVGLAASLVMPEIARGALRSNVRLIAFERPGFGQSTPTRDYRFETVAADVEELLHRLGIKSVSLFGDGYGGAFAAATALRLQGSVRRLALRSPSLGRALGNDRQSILSALCRQPWIIPGVAELMHRGIRVSLVRALMRHYAERSASDAARAAEPEFATYFDGVVFDALEHSGKGLASELALFGSGVRVDPSQLTLPIAVWHGAEHPGIPASESIASFAGHNTATLHILEGVGSYLAQPVFDDIFAWLTGASPRYPK